MSCVYKHTFPNGAVYIGKTDANPEDRWLNGWGYKNCPLMFNAIIKFGWDNVNHEILYDNLTKEEATKIEIVQIREHSLRSVMTYNIQHVSPQYIAQENAHYIPETTPQIIPQSKIVHNVPKRTVIPRKQHIVPLTEKPDNVRTCAINVYTQDGEFIATYPSAKIASQEMGVNHGDIISCCKGKKSDGQPRYQVKGFVFRYAL